MGPPRCARQPGGSPVFGRPCGSPAYPVPGRSTVRWSSRLGAVDPCQVVSWRHGEPGDPDRRRRPRGVPGGGPGRPAPLRRPLPGAAGLLRAGSAGRAARGQTARRTGGAAAGRPPDAGDDRGGVPRGGHGHLPGRPPGAAHRVRGHRRRDRGHQRGRPGPLPAQAVASAGGEAVPGGGRAVGGVGGHPGRGQRRDPGRRAPLVGAVVQGPRLPRPQPGAVPLDAVRRPGGRPPARRGRCHRGGRTAGGDPRGQGADRPE